MKPNPDKIDDAVLALLHLTSFTERPGELPRAWKAVHPEVVGGRTRRAATSSAAFSGARMLPTFGFRPLNAGGVVAARQPLPTTSGCTPWKGHDWDALDRLHDKGLISDPVGKARSVLLTEEGAGRAADLFKKPPCD